MSKKLLPKIGSNDSWPSVIWDSSLAPEFDVGLFLGVNEVLPGLFLLSHYDYDKTYSWKTPSLLIPWIWKCFFDALFWRLLGFLERYRILLLYFTHVRKAKLLNPSSLLYHLGPFLAYSQFGTFLVSGRKWRRKCKAGLVFQISQSPQFPENEEYFNLLTLLLMNQDFSARYFLRNNFSYHTISVRKNLKRVGNCFPLH